MTILKSYENNVFKQNISKEIWDKKYRNGNETYAEYCTRIASTLANTENEFEQLHNLLFNQYVSFAGRIMYGVGTGKQNITFSNCYVMPIERDSMDAIIEAVKKAALTMKAGGGVGYNFSILRPKGATINTTGGISSGVISFMSIFDSACATILSGNSRRGAQMGILDVWHPEVEDFIIAKRNGGLSNFNISVGIYDAFMDAVDKDGDWHLEFPDYEKCPNEYNTIWDGNLGNWKAMGLPTKIYKTVKAKELYDKIIKSNYDFAEPGVVFIDTINKYNNLNYCEFINATNPCLPEFATVLTKDGIRKLGEINIGDIIWSGEQWTKVINKWKTGHKPVYKYETSVGNFIGTENHRIVSKGQKIEVRNADTIDISVGEYKPILEHDKQAIIDGLVLGDGSYHKASDNILLYIGNKDGDYFTSEIKGFIGKNYNKENTYKVNTTITKNELPLTFERTIPERYFKGDRKVVASFLRGLFSANGSICGDRITLKQASKTMIKQVQEMLSGIGIKSYVTVNKGKYCDFPNGTYYSKQNYTLNITSDRDKFLESIGFLQKYKMKRLRDIQFISELKASRSKKSYEILHIEYLGDYDVYDITVEAEEHTFWSGGLLVSNCGEQPLVAYGSCNLASINLAKLVENPFADDTTINYNLLVKCVKALVRGLDKVLDINYHPIIEQALEIENKRQIGIGITGLGDMLAMLGIKYSSKEGVQKAEDVMKFIANRAYYESAMLAKAKGHFPYYDSEKILQSEFVKKLDDDVKEAIAKYGLRNSRLLSIAPTGTISLVMNNVSSGIEPIFSLEYTRKIRNIDNTYSEQKVKDYAWLMYEKITGNTEKPDFFETALEIDVDAHLNMQSALQKWVDTSISKTINIPADYDYEDFKQVYKKAHVLELKGCTTYRPNNIVGSILSTDTKEPNTKDDEVFKKKELDDIEYAKRHRITWKNGTKVYVNVSVDKQNTPIEIFAKLPKKAGFGSDDLFDPALYLDRQSDWEFICRLQSKLLRIGYPLSEIIDDANKSAFTMHSLPALMARILNEYVSKLSDDEKEQIKQNKTGMICPECGEQTLVKEQGCNKCLECGYSKCS